MNTAHAITVTKDITYNNQGERLDLYLPDTFSKSVALIFVHGGGFDRGIKDDMTFHAQHFANLGYVATSIDYRLSSNDRYPSAKNDALDAVIWMKNNSQNYQFDSNKIMIVGYSAGGLVALNAGLDSTSGVAAIVSGAGVTDIDAIIQNGATSGLEQDVLTYMDGAPTSIASPVNQVTASAPPVLMFHGDVDNIVPITQSYRLRDRLLANQVLHELVEFELTGHDLMLETNSNIQNILQKIEDWAVLIDGATPPAEENGEVPFPIWSILIMAAVLFGICSRNQKS